MRIEETQVTVNNSFKDIGANDITNEENFAQHFKREGEQTSTKQWVTKKFTTQPDMMGQMKLIRIRQRAI